MVIFYVDSPIHEYLSTELSTDIVDNCGTSSITFHGSSYAAWNKKINYVEFPAKDIVSTKK
ncbi:MAG: hypothetical protein ACC707_18700, partial [Thiohalomonadales bacterium]